MADLKSQPSPKPTERSGERSTVPPIKVQAPQPTLKPNKNVRVPKYHLEHFSGGDKES